MRPPVPPPVPPAPGPVNASAAAAGGLPAIVHRPSRRRRTGHGPILAIVLLLAAAAVVIAAVVAWPDRRGHRQPRAEAGTPKPLATPVSPPGGHAARVAPAAPPRPEAVRNAAAASSAPPRGVEPDVPRSAPPSADGSAAAEANDDRSRAEVEHGRPAAAVDQALASTLAALRMRDTSKARQSAESAASAAGDDAVLRRRVDRWLLLVDYAAQLAGHRREAAESAAKGREYEVDGRTIGIVELTPEAFAYKVAGRVERGPRDELPQAIDQAILAAWFAGDGRAANHIFLGIARLLEPHPDLAAVRAEWETALRGEPATAPLMPLLDDPLFIDGVGQ